LLVTHVFIGRKQTIEPLPPPGLLEYPFQALLRERNPAVRFWHVGVDHPARPCAVFCPDCAGVPGKADSYRYIGPPIEIGHFLLFLPPAR